MAVYTEGDAQRIILLTSQDNGATWQPSYGGAGGGGNNGVNTVLNGSGTPSGTSGAVGDFYIDTTNLVLYGPKNNSGWGSGVTLVGPTGATGATGATGPTGVVAATAPVTYDSGTQTVALNVGTGLTTSGSNLVASFGSTAGTVTEGNDSRLSDARTPTSHATSHKSGGTDAIRLDEFAVPTASVSMNSQRLVSVGSPSAGSDAATKSYVDGKQNVFVQSSAPTGVSGTYVWVDTSGGNLKFWVENGL